MKTTPAGFLAVAGGWAATLMVFAGCLKVTRGHVEDFGPMALWTGLFALVGWAVLVQPLLRRTEHWRALRDGRWGWLSWSVLAMAVYSLIVPPLLGKEMFEVLWYPAIMGGIAGLVFAWLVKPPRELKLAGAQRGCA